jgi:hypothetical protein
MKCALLSIGLAGLLLTVSLPGSAQLPPPAGPRVTTQKEIALQRHAAGTFEVKTTPQPSEDAAASPTPDPTADPNLARFLLDKHYHGDIEAIGKGQMLTAGTSVKGSAGYVAMEKVTGTLGGHTGTFVLQHIGVMNRGAMELAITVVPDSGTGELAGLAGRMNITIKDGKHFYNFEYTLTPVQ